MQQEPVIAGYTVTAILTSIVSLLVVFDVWSPSPDQLAAVTATVVMVVSIVAAVIVRGKVSPTVNLDKPAAGAEV